MKFIITLILTLSSIFAIIDINTATLSDLISLKGIGKKKGEAIILYRKSIKCFKSLEDLQQVKGIGVVTLNKNRKNLKASLCTKVSIKNKKSVILSKKNLKTEIK